MRGNAGSNPSSYTYLSLPILGTDYLSEVDLAGTTGHAVALLYGDASSATIPLGGGPVMLINPGDPLGELLGPLSDAGSRVPFSVPIPLDLSLAGFPLSTQAVHIGVVRPFALSNALDLILGF